MKAKLIKDLIEDLKERDPEVLKMLNEMKKYKEGEQWYKKALVDYEGYFRRVEEGCYYKGMPDSFEMFERKCRAIREFHKKIKKYGKLKEEFYRTGEYEFETEELGKDVLGVFARMFA